MMRKQSTISPKTHSEILWHFTGGPRWSDRSNHQLKNRKTSKQAYEALCDILNSKELKVGNYHEIIKVKLSDILDYDAQKKKFTNIHNVERSIKTAKVCCVADIPLSELFYHGKRYGNMAIGFKRSSLVKAGFNPVLYILDDKPLVRNFYYAQNSLQSIDESTSDIIEELQSEVENIFDEHDIDNYVDFSEAGEVIPP